MSRTIRLFYRQQKGRLPMNFNWGINPPITHRSVVVMSAGEGTLTPGLGDPADHGTFKLGAADVFVTNVSPHDGGVEFILHANWGTPIDVLVDLTVLDPIEDFFVV